MIINEFSSIIYTSLSFGQINRSRRKRRRAFASTQFLLQRYRRSVSVNHLGRRSTRDKTVSVIRNEHERHEIGARASRVPEVSERHVPFQNVNRLAAISGIRPDLRIDRRKMTCRATCRFIHQPRSRPFGNQASRVPGRRVDGRDWKESTLISPFLRFGLFCVTRRI